MKKVARILFTTIISAIMFTALCISVNAAETINIVSYSEYVHDYLKYGYTLSNDGYVSVQLMDESGEFIDRNIITACKGSNYSFYWIDGMPGVYTLRLKAIVNDKTYYSDSFRVTKTDKHIYKNYFSNNDATCTANGTESSCCVCPMCFSQNTREVSGSAGHKNKTSVKAATTKKGGKVTVKCEVCGKIKSSTTVSKIAFCKLSKSAYAYTGKKLKPEIVVKDSAGNKLKSGSDYTVSYTDNKNVGTANVTVNFKGKYRGKASLSFDILPAKVKGLKAKAEKGGFLLAWTKHNTPVDGYEVQYSTTKDFRRGTKNTFYIKGYDTVSKKVLNLTAQKTYYIRIRATKEVGDAVKKSVWSDAVKVRTLKGYSTKKGNKVDRYASPEMILNSAALNPLMTNDDGLDAKITSILKKITKDNMTTYEKVRAIHNYMIKNFTYDAKSGPDNKYGYASAYDAAVVDLASDMLRNKAGVCDHWSALFMVFTRSIGLESYLQNGQINVNGKWSGHVWNTIRINGYDYLFDTEVDFRNSKAGKSGFTNFCVVQTSKYKYAGKSANMKAFKEFRLGMN